MSPRLRIVGLGSCLLAFAAAVWWVACVKSTRNDYWPNRPPAANLAGSNSCIDCHADAGASYAKTAMAHSAARLDKALMAALGANILVAPTFPFKYELSANPPVFELSESLADTRGNPIYRQQEQIAWAIGSGAHARTFVVERPGAHWFEAPLTWYRSLGGWSMSPGYDRIDHRRFAREISVDCSFCHFGQVAGVVGSRNRYSAQRPVIEAAISCERCHGPCRDHVDFHSGVRSDLSATAAAAVNPAKLELRLANDVCLQCHRTGLKGSEVLRPGRVWNDFRPGMPLTAIVQQFADADAGETTDAGIHFTGKMAQLASSRCYIASSGKMNCLTCHSIHHRPAADKLVESQRNNCLACHRDHGCAEPLPKRLAKQRDDSCVACHMAKIAPSDVPHTTITDHRIRKPAAATAMVASKEWRPLVAAPIPDLSAAEAKRNLGIAYGNRAVERNSAEDRTMAIRLLEETKLAFATDPQHGLALGLTHATAGEPRLAVPFLQLATRLQPDLEVAHNALASAANAVGDRRLARKSAERSLQLNPYKVDMLLLLASLELGDNRFAEAGRLFARVLEVDAGNRDARLGLQYAERRAPK